ncbi:MAG: hypothetical protein KGJ98_00260 [Chloroflexota bacterium]|nr:hypothetical protein [Chloroflexota bacterium]
MSDLRSDVEKAIEPFAEALRSDGYEIGVTNASPEVVELKIVALEGACEDCLVPEHVMAPMIAETLPASLKGATVRIEYPAHTE